MMDKGTICHVVIFLFANDFTWMLHIVPWTVNDANRQVACGFMAMGAHGRDFILHANGGQEGHLPFGQLKGQGTINDRGRELQMRSGANHIHRVMALI